MLLKVLAGVPDDIAVQGAPFGVAREPRFVPCAWPGRFQRGDYAEVSIEKGRARPFGGCPPAKFERAPVDALEIERFVGGGVEFKGIALRATSEAAEENPFPGGEMGDVVLRRPSIGAGLLQLFI